MGPAPPPPVGRRSEPQRASLAQVNIRYSKKMEELKEELDASIAKRKDSAIGKASTVAAAASIPLRLYGKASLAIRQVGAGRGPSPGGFAWARRPPGALSGRRLAGAGGV